MKKKMLSFVSLGLVCVTFFLSCMTKNPDEVEQLDKILEVPEKIISNHKATLLFKNDHSTRLTKIGAEKIGFEDKAIHFKLETITNYITHLEHSAIAKNIPITGISFVFGAKTNGKRTIFLMPTTRNAALDYQESFTVENGQFLTFKRIDQVLSPKQLSRNDENLILATNGYVSFNEAVELFNRYENQYIKPFAAKVAKEYYTKAVWYSLKEMKAYCTYLQKKSSDHNLAISGIDVFFGVYNTDPNLELKSNAQTIFLTASSQKTSIIDIEGNKFKTVVQNDFYQKIDTDSTDESLAFNMGQLSPPPPKK
ncbi:hypothetical protein [Kordia jejudonensis]|uniref:hypothetical protein n=1 Tax=Kordia jejudonensis TaxID=1348245 RepID=UPI0009E51DF1|nr:hypothetical protein [Kordia jejudonensis]